MGYANHIGRVGALAVALGVGTAVAEMPAIAWAETTDSATSADADKPKPSGGTAAEPSPGGNTKAESSGPAGPKSRRRPPKHRAGVETPKTPAGSASPSHSDDSQPAPRGVDSSSGDTPSSDEHNTATPKPSTPAEKASESAVSTSETTPSGGTTNDTSAETTALQPESPIPSSAGAPSDAGPAPVIPSDTSLGATVPVGDTSTSASDVAADATASLSPFGTTSEDAQPAGSSHNRVTVSTPSVTSATVFEPAPITPAAAARSELAPAGEAQTFDATAFAAPTAALSSRPEPMAFAALPTSTVDPAPAPTPSILTGLLSAIGLKTAASPNPTAPTNPLGELVWALFRRVESTFANDAPDATNDALTTSQGIAATGNVLRNDTDADGDALKAALLTGAQHGTVALNADGSFTYTPTAGYTGTDTFTYKVSDDAGGFHLHGLLGFLRPGGGHTDTAKVTITVISGNEAPVADDDTYTVAEDNVLKVLAAAGVLANDTDADNTPTQLSAVLGTGPTNGTLALNADGSFTYTATANYNGPDSFTYRASDGTANSAPATVSITVTPVNDAPVVTNDTATTVEDTPVTIAVLANDTDVEKSPLTPVLAAQPINGTVLLNPDNTYTYTPGSGFAGTDSFTYTANDGDLDSTAATVTITVTPRDEAPVANNDTATTVEGTPVTIDVLANDTDADSNVLTPQLVSQPANGSLSATATGWTYTPSTNFSGADSFTYTISDGTTTSNAATVTVTVNPKGPGDDGTDPTDNLTALDRATLDALVFGGAVQTDEDQNGVVTAIIGTFTNQKVNDAAAALTVLNSISTLLGADDGFSGAIDTQISEFTTDSGPFKEIYYRLTETVDGIPVLGSNVILTTAADGTVTGVFSGLDPAAYGIDTTPSQTIDDAQEIAAAATQVLLHSLGSALSTEDTEAFVNSLTFQTNLVIYPPNADDQPALAWQVDVGAPIVLNTEATEPEATSLILTIARYYIYANGAEAGSLLAQHALVDEAWSPETVTADGLPHGDGGLFDPPVSYTIKVQTDGSTSQMVDASRHITVYNGSTHHINGIAGPTSGSGPDWAYDLDAVFTFDSDVVTEKVWPFGWDRSAVSAMANMETVVDYYKRLKWDFSKIPNSSGIQVGLVDKLTKNAGAHWDPILLNFAFGSDTEAALDVVGHEFTHAVQYSISPATAGFQGSQGKALAEAYGDILGNLIEGKSGADRWLVAEDVPGYLPSRDMQDPENPSTAVGLKGFDNYSEFKETGDEHQNAGIFDRAAYLMMTDSDTVLVSDATWAEIFYTSMKRLPSFPTFQNARNAVIASASVLGLDASEQKAIADAFDAVRIKTTPRVQIILDWDSTTDLDAHLT